MLEATSNVGTAREVEALSTLEGVVSRLRDKAEKALAELKERASAVKRWHELHDKGAAVVDEHITWSA
jgi:C4-type Zn-finger protein